jgi:hypothetical protein
MLTAIWQSNKYREAQWIEDLFGSYLDRHVFDGTHSVVMDHCLLIDNFIDRVNESYYRAFEGKQHVYLLHLSDEQYSGGYNAYKYFTSVFRNYWSSIFNPRRVHILPLGYSRGLKHTRGLKQASDRTYLWSFAGEVCRASRPEMITALGQVYPHFLHATDLSATSPLAPDEYRSVLEDTIFAPSPMGRINLECFRFYEALECSSIPIVERRCAMNYYRNLLGDHPVISISNWQEARTLIVSLQAEPEHLNSIQKSIVEWWKAYKNQLRVRIGEVLSKNTEAWSSRSATKWRYRLPCWQALELSRHHSVKALARRFAMQCRRLVQA